MKDECQRRPLPALPVPGRTGLDLLARVLRRVSFLALTLGFLAAGQAAAPEAGVDQASEAAAPPPLSRTTRRVAAALLVVTALMLPKLASLVERRLGPETIFPDEAAGFPVGKPASSKLTASLRSGLTVHYTAFQAAAPKLILQFRQLLAKAEQKSEGPYQLEVFRVLARRLHEFSSMNGIPDAPPVWQLTCALACFVEGLAEKPNQPAVTPLRTIESALDLLRDLCRPGVRPDLFTNPPLSLLAVDDDPISRHAVSLALRKMLVEPDLAGDAEAASALIKHHAYDVIFLDVEMPGMNGIELAAKVRDTALNAATPVIFVTCHDDAETQVKIGRISNRELVLKPFAIVELTVKSLVVALRNRLQHDQAAKAKSQTPAETQPVEASASPEAQPAEDDVLPGLRASQKSDSNRSGSKENLDSTAQGQTAISDETAAKTLASEEGDAEVALDGSNDVLDSSPGVSNDTVLARASTHIEALQALFEELTETPPGEAREELLNDLELGLRAFQPMAELAELREALQVSRTLEGPVYELAGRNGAWTADEVREIADGLRSLQDMCQATSAQDKPFAALAAN